jgi:hypothetical protein
MVTYMHNPQIQLIIYAGAVPTTYTNDAVESITLRRIENGFDTATIMISDTQGKNYNAKILSGDLVIISIKELDDASYTNLFAGIADVIIPIKSEMGETLTIKCNGAGYGLVKTAVGQEYGSQSLNKTVDTASEILTDTNLGIIPKYVNKVMGSATDSGYAYTTTLGTLTGTILYLYFPYKPCNKALDDICDLLTAMNAGSSGPHWIVTTDFDLKMKLINEGVTGWPQYYGGNATAGTLTEGIDFASHNFQKMDVEANYILYYGAFRRPNNGDAWTENNSGLWGHDAHITLADSNSVYQVGAYSLRIESQDGLGGYCYYPPSQNAYWDITKLGNITHIPSLNFYVRRSDTIARAWVGLRTGPTPFTNYFLYNFTDLLSAPNVWFHVSLPIGPYWDAAIPPSETQRWTTGGTSPSWSRIDFVEFYLLADATKYLYVDGLHFGGAPVCRVAYDSTSITNDKLRIKVITDNVGKDDSLKVGDDSGLMAQMAYAELLNGRKTPLIGQVLTPIIKDILPGQWVHIHAKPDSTGAFKVNADFRVTEIIHTMIPKQTDGYKTQLTLTDDLTNSHPRRSFADWNAVIAAQRPNYQDRQAASIKAGDVDVTIQRLEKDYPS